MTDSTDYIDSAGEDSIELLERDKERLRDALKDIVRRVRHKEDRVEVLAEIASTALDATP